ncbi:MAG: hypothetical protein WD749_12745 [Phycisphaerales bacterium]
MPPRPRRRLSLALLTAALASEFIAFAWWSPVDLSGPHQRYLTLARGELRLGARGTAGFFTRAIPAPGARLQPPARIPTDAHYRYWLPRSFSVMQTRGLALPLYPLGALLAAAGLALLLRRRARPGHCPACGYDLSGLRAETCPECGEAGGR